MERYDVAIIGAGPDGLIAAALLARAGLRVIVLERSRSIGGRAATHEFHPGFHASLFADELAAIPKQLFWSLDLARHGALMLPAPASTCFSADGVSILPADEEGLSRSVASFSAPGVLSLRQSLARLSEALGERAAIPKETPRSRFRPWRRQPPAPWPGESLGQISLAEALAARIGEPALQTHLAAAALCGRTASPFLSGSALHLLGIFRSGQVAGGSGALAQALRQTAEQAGAQIRTEAEVNDVRLARSRLTGLRAGGVVLNGQEEIRSRAVLSTLDAKRSFLTLFSWNDLPRDLVKQAAQFRMAGQCARVLLALDAPPEFAFARECPQAGRGPLHVVSSLESLSRAFDSWRASTLPEEPPVTLRVPSFTDPGLAPAGKAVMTATIGAIPARLFDGAWTSAKRELLRNAALRAAEVVCPGLRERVLAMHVVTAPDIEASLGLTEGDLDGGEIAPDQVLSFRPWQGMEDGRTPIRSFYLAGPSAAPSPFLLGVAGSRAAQTVLYDLKEGRLR